MNLEKNYNAKDYPSFKVENRGNNIKIFPSLSNKGKVHGYVEWKNEKGHFFKKMNLFKKDNKGNLEVTIDPRFSFVAVQMIYQNSFYENKIVYVSSRGTCWEN